MSRGSKQQPFLEFPQMKPPILTIKWKPNSIEIAPSCPRCFSSNTKFCYYNNYSVSQPRYFCKSCRRYWTKGGSLRNVPIGGGCRKTRRNRNRSRTTTPSPPPAETGAPAADRKVVKDCDCSDSAAASSAAAFECRKSVIDGGDERLREVHGSLVYEDNFGVFEVEGSDEMFWNFGSVAAAAPPLMGMQEFEVFSSDDDDRLRIMSDENLITDNWGSFDLSAYDNFQ